MGRDTIMWIESIYFENEIVNLDNIISIKKIKDSGIKFKHWDGDFVWWSYPNRAKRDEEYSYIKLYIKPVKMGVHSDGNK